jgi:hypothetical protein
MSRSANGGNNRAIGTKREYRLCHTARFVIKNSVEPKLTQAA